MTEDFPYPPRANLTIRPPRLPFQAFHANHLFTGDHGICLLGYQLNHSPQTDFMLRERTEGALAGIFIIPYSREFPLPR